MKGTVYILLTRNNRYYIGSTQDLARRLHEHEQGESKATKYILPIKLVFSQEFKSLKLARRIEYKLKKLKRRDIIKEIVRDKKIKMEP